MTTLYSQPEKEREDQATDQDTTAKKGSHTTAETDGPIWQVPTLTVTMINYKLYPAAWP